MEPEKSRMKMTSELNLSSSAKASNSGKNLKRAALSPLSFVARMHTGSCRSLVFISRMKSLSSLTASSAIVTTVHSPSLVIFIRCDGEESSATKLESTRTVRPNR